jgi:hypothetical protein
MKFKSVALIGLILSLITIFILANRIENGDINAVSMYLVVFLLPSIILAILNALYIQLIDKYSNRSLKIIFSFIPIVILIVISLMKKLTIPFIDGDLTFVATIGSIALGITNLIWAINFLSIKTSLNK